MRPKTLKTSQNNSKLPSLDPLGPIGAPGIPGIPDDPIGAQERKRNCQQLFIFVSRQTLARMSPSVALWRPESPEEALKLPCKAVLKVL